MLIIYKMFLLWNVVSFEKGSNGQNHSISDSHPQHSPVKFSIPLLMGWSPYLIILFGKSWILWWDWKCKSSYKTKLKVLWDNTLMKHCGYNLKGTLSSLRSFLATESLLKIMQNAFYFTLKAILVLKIFKFLFWHFGHVEKRLDLREKVNFKIYDIIVW